MTSKQTDSPRAFTAVELLVAVGVVALAVAALLPSLQAARTAAQTASCLDNQRQMGGGLHQYATDYNYLPGYNPYQYGAGAVITPFAFDYKNPASPVYQVYGSVTVNLWADTAQENSPGMAALPPYPAPPPNGFGLTPQTTAVGIGCVAPYISSTGHPRDANGKVFYCPGNPVSFAATASGPAWYPNQYKTPGPDNVNTYHTTWGGYYGGWSNFGAPSTYTQWVSAGRPVDSGSQMLNADNSCLATYSYRGGDWSIDKGMPLTSPQWAYNWTGDGGGTSYFGGMLLTASSPYVQNRVCVTDWWFNLESYNDVADYGDRTWPQNMPHGGTVVNNLWTDGHAATYTLTPGVIQNGNTFNVGSPLWGWTDQAWAQGPTGSKTLAGYQPTSNSPWVGFYHTMPFWWAIADQNAP